MIRPSDDDTIAAIATPPGEGGIGVVRISGKKAIAIAESIFAAASKIPVSAQENHTASFGRLIDRTSGGREEVIDEALLIVMRAPKSYTCEDVVEFQTHGGYAILQKVLSMAIRQGARLAENGEFTKRAFLNGRLDLLQAEAVLDLIQAKTDLARRWASAQLEGKLSERMKSMKDSLLDLLASLEAAIDFSDDATEAPAIDQIKKTLQGLEADMAYLLKTADRALVIKRGLKVVIFGRPNTGKSSLLNALVGKNRAIVTPYAGTTRDLVEEEVQISGCLVRLADTAGVRSTEHPIEKEGVMRSRLALGEADLVIALIDASESLEGQAQIFSKEVDEKKKIIVLNKIDLPRKITRKAALDRFPGQVVVEISCATLEGIEALEKIIGDIISGGQIQQTDEAVVSSLRQKDLVAKTLRHIQQAITTCQEEPMPDLVAVDVRAALDCLGMMVGEVYTEDILDLIFSKFCIGK